MSSDARAWKPDPDKPGWKGSHDGGCNQPHEDPWSLSAVLLDLEICLERPLRWQIEDGGPRGFMLFGWIA